MNFSSVGEKIGKTAYRVGGVLLLVAIAALVWRRNRIVNFGVYIPTVKPSDVLIPLSFLALLVAITCAPSIRATIRERWAFLRSWVIRWVAFLGFFVVGSLYATSVFHKPFLEDSDGYLRIGIGLTGFFLLLVFGSRNERYVRLATLAFLSALIMTPFLGASVETVFAWFAVVSPAGYAFIGFQPGASILGSFLVFPAALLFAFVLNRRLSAVRAAAFLGLVLLVALALWTTSRAAWAAIVVAFAVMIAVRAFRGMPKRAVVFVSCAALAAFVLGLAILSPPARNAALVRVFPHLKAELVMIEGKAVVPTDIPQKYFLWLPTFEFLRATSLVIDVGFRESRGRIWTGYLELFLRHPLGVGPGYAAMFVEKGLIFCCPNGHNIWLQVALSGGVGGLVVFFLVIRAMVIRAVRLVPQSDDPVVLGIIGGFAGMLVNAFFIDALDFRWFWVILALVVVAYENQIAPRASSPPDHASR